MGRPIGGFSLIPKRKLSDQFLGGNLIKQIVQTVEQGGEQADYLKHDYEYDSGWGRELKLYPKRKMVDLSGSNNLSILTQHIVGMVPEPITILKIWYDLAIAIPKISLAVAEDHSGGGFTATPSLTIPEPSVSHAQTATTVNACGGAVAHDDDGADTDETTEANEATANDMTLLQADGAATDWYALGYASKFDAVCVNVGTAGADITLDTFEYSTGAGTWSTLTPSLDLTNDWETTGKIWFTFAQPGDWATATYASIADMYWIKFKASDTGVSYTQPLGTQAWILVYA